MRVTFASEAAPGHPNEDFIASTPDALVLLDGAGTPVDSESGCVHGVAWYARSLGSTLLAGMTQGTGTLTEILAEGIKAVASLHDFICDLDHPGSPSATVIMIRRTAGVLDFLVLADSVLVLDVIGAAEPTVVCDKREATVGTPYRAAMDALDTGSSAHVTAHRRYVETLRDHRNRDGGFWIAAVDPLTAEQALTGTVRADQVRAVALLSDGASRLVDRFHLASWRQALGILEESGPDELIRQVREAEHADPAGSRWPRGKTHDNATAAYCLLSGEGFSVRRPEPGAE
ncbi:protein phosphatase 2C domain-containing protein [Streptosporangium sp. 'caverna']|uniref:protein phosphatase 2C domain-containing protein n=1 Tax=Streptosporangium sp. 'caverna' TaxID=2202249 RepID=UPI000D7DDD12|nr:protein phosphatase 2C domain-containing protein [Streptosporangium sp. 'caverna']AWS47823.1 integrase [Streptosporangium sp. 'caverna']